LKTEPLSIRFWPFETGAPTIAIVLAGKRTGRYRTVHGTFDRHWKKTTAATCRAGCCIADNVESKLALPWLVPMPIKQRFQHSPSLSLSRMETAICAKNATSRDIDTAQSSEYHQKKGRILSVPFFYFPTKKNKKFNRTCLTIHFGSCPA
jgi:hypothetical protein